MSFQQKEKKKDINNSQSSHSGSQQPQNEVNSDSLQDNFIVNDQQSVQDQFYYPRKKNDSDDSGSEKKKSKKDRKRLKKLKRQRMKQEQSQLDQGDLDILEQQQQGGRLNRLKKKKQKKNKMKFQDQEQLQIDDFQVEESFQGMASQSGHGDREASDQEQSRLNQVLGGNQGQDIFEPQDQKRLFRQQEDKQIISMDIPERYYYQLRNYAKIHNKSIEDVMKIFQCQDRNAQAKWIYKKCRFSGDQRTVQQKIKNVLDALHKDRLQIMFIYYYRRKLYSDVLSRSDLLKIYKLDQQWLTFKQQFNKIKDNLVSVIFSFQQMPRLEDMLQDTVDIQRLNYFRQFQAFKLPPSNDSKKKNFKKQIISQIHQRGVSDWLKKSQTFLSPDNLCHNFRNRNSDKKAKNPISQPRQQLQKLLRSSNPQNDKIKYPLLIPQKRIQTICHYLELQLFSHPELRQKLKQKYYQHLVISTTPTLKGNQDINLYSVYFPVKRIKQKPIYTLNRQVWILACEAQKNDLINIQLKFQWDPTGTQQRNFDGDKVFKEIIKYYYDVSVHKQGQVWNLFRKQVIMRMLQYYFFPAFFKEIKQELTKEGTQIIINAACSELKKKLLVTPQKNRKLSMVLQDKKLGIVFVDQDGRVHSPLQITLLNDKQLKQFANDQIIKKYIQDFKPYKICVGANSRRAQTLRKALRQIQHLPFSDLCPYQIPSLVAKQKRLQGSSQQLTVLQAISMARFQINPMLETLSLWSDNINENGILSLNLHPFQSFVDQRRLKNSLELIAFEVVNLVGIDLNDLNEKFNPSGKKALQFICGFGPRKAFDFYEKIQNYNINNRQQIKQLLSGDLLFRNSSPFFKIDNQNHKSLLEKNQKDKKKEKFHQINLLDSTRIPIQWYSLTESLTLKAIKSGFDMRQRKIYMNYSQETIALVEMFKHPEKVNSIQWTWKRQQNPNFDEKLVRQQITSRFKMPSQNKYDFNNQELFYSLLRQTKHTLKKYMIVTVKIISVSKDNRFLNVVIPQNGLFGSIKIHQNRADYQPGNYIKAMIGSFPFQQSYNQRPDQKQQQLLKVDMLLNFPHKTESTSHDCFQICFHQIVKEIHPLIDLDKERFDLKKEDRPIIQVKQQSSRTNKTQFRKISHKKFKNLAVGPAVQLIRNSPIGQFVIRPSSDGAQFLNITWNFFSGIIAHIKVKSQQKSSSISAYKIISDKDNRNYQSLDEIIDQYINPINNIVQDVISNRKFMADPIDKIEQACKLQMNKQPNLIHYFFGCSPDYPQYFLLVYMYRQKKPYKQLIKVRNTGLHFHEQVFNNLKQLIGWFKNHFKDKQYQAYVKKYSIKK